MEDGRPARLHFLGGYGFGVGALSRSTNIL